MNRVARVAGAVLLALVALQALVTVLVPVIRPLVVVATIVFVASLLMRWLLGSRKEW